MTAATRNKRPERAAFKTSFLDEARALGLVGCIAGPSDLSRNRAKYLKERSRTRHARSR
jgi:hypothetical protein